ncbi:hypothetical protein EDC04DRAFT_2726319, partial [Pisolithus marmoratus]
TNFKFLITNLALLSTNPALLSTNLALLITNPELLVIHPELREQCLPRLPTDKILGLEWFYFLEGIVGRWGASRIIAQIGPLLPSPLFAFVSIIPGSH